MKLLTILFFGFLSLTGFCGGICIERERQALLELKQGLVDPADRLSSWVANDGDCCKWKGVFCHNLTGRVLQLHLSTSSIQISKFGPVSFTGELGGKISPSLQHLKYLSYLNLSNNNFGAFQIPKFFGSLKSLRFLDLSNAGFAGKIPPHLGNLSNLQYLNLADNYYLHDENLHWLSGLSSLEHLDLSFNNLGRASNWFHFVNTLLSLVELHLANSRLPEVQAKAFPSVNLSSLVSLDLSGNFLVNLSTINWVFGLKNLVFLDLSRNDFSGSFSCGFQNLTFLKHLDLSGNSLVNLSTTNCGFGLKNLVFLDLSDIAFSGSFPCGFQNLTFLKHLDLSGNFLVNLSTINWAFGLKNLVFLDLSYNDFSGSFPCGFQNLTFLKHLDLSGNGFNSSIPNWLYSFSPLEFLDISYNNLQGHISAAIGEMNFVVNLDFSNNIDLQGKIPRSKGNLCSLKSISFSSVNLSQEISDVLEAFSGCVSNALESLDLSNCQLSGQLTNQLENFKNLRRLILRSNKLNGNLPESLGKCANLEKVDISNNCLEGTVFEIHFANLTKLKSFNGSGNSIILKVNPVWLPPFQIQNLQLRGWHLGPRFPHWLQSQKSLTYLDISCSRISETIPSWFWEYSSQFIIHLNLSHNQFQGQLPKKLNGWVIDFSSNNFTGPLSLISSNVSLLDLSNNRLSGSITHSLCHEMNESTNMMIMILNLGKNTLSGELPDCWTKQFDLETLILSNNRFSGEIPSSIGALTFLGLLHLQNNHLSGEIPYSLRNCTWLRVLDLSENKLDGNIPPWIGISLTNLIILKLSRNKFWGHISHELCVLSSLQILDFAHNNLSGGIPRCVGNLRAMVMESEYTSSLYSFEILIGDVDDIGETVDVFSSTYFLEDVSVVKKSQVLEYNRTLPLVKVMDFSSNNLSGEIPSEITILKALQSLNLSNNVLSGRIPENIGNMRMLESLDLSLNELSGPIPGSMTSLTFLGYLDISYNQLIGKIPTGTQLQSFNTSSYAGNKLCGPPLSDNCSAVGSPPIIPSGGGVDGVKINWLFVSMALGFIVGFWSFLSPLVFNRHWRYRYYQFLDQVWWKISDFVGKCF